MELTAYDLAIATGKGWTVLYLDQSEPTKGHQKTIAKIHPVIDLIKSDEHKYSQKTTRLLA